MQITPAFRQWFRISALLALVGFILLLPELSGRVHLMDSLWGRIFVVTEYFQNTQLPTIIFGNGLGVGTNTAASLFTDWSSNQPIGLPKTTVFIADSMLMALTAQLGLIGVTLYYYLLFYAAERDNQASLFYVMVFIASLTTNIAELYPVNAITGLLLCRSLLMRREELA